MPNLDRSTLRSHSFFQATKSKVMKFGILGIRGFRDLLTLVSIM